MAALRLCVGLVLYAGTNFPLLTSMMVSSAPNRAQDFPAYSLASLRGAELT
jgi:hypothetical protein